MNSTDPMYNYYHPTPNTGQLGFNKSKADSYEEWVIEVKGRVGRNSQWDRIGLWLYPTKSNRGWKQVAFHLCENGRHSTSCIELDEACSCGGMIPEGIRMVILLESL